MSEAEGENARQYGRFHKIVPCGEVRPLRFMLPGGGEHPVKHVESAKGVVKIIEAPEPCAIVAGVQTCHETFTVLPAEIGKFLIVHLRCFIGMSGGIKEKNAVISV